MKTPYEKRSKFGFSDYVKGKNINKYRIYYIILILALILIGTVFQI